MGEKLREIKEWCSDRITFLVVSGILISVFLVVLLILWGNRSDVGGVAIPWDWLWITLFVAYTLGSLQTVQPNKMGVLLLWGKPVQNVESGLKLVPLGIYTLEQVIKSRIQIELPGEPEQIWKLEDENQKELPVGIGRDGQPVKPPTVIQDGEEKTLPWVRPLRITTASMASCKLKIDFPHFRGKKETTDDGGKKVRTEAYETYLEARAEYEEREKSFREDVETYGATDPYHDRLTVEPITIVRFRIDDFEQFIQVIHSVEEAKKQIHDTVIGRVQYEFARRTPTLLLAHLGTINQRLLEDVEVLVGERVDVLTGERRDQWGIKVEDVYVKLLGTTETVSRSIAEKMAAGFEREKLRQQGEGRGLATKAEIKADALGIMELAKIAKTPGGRDAIAAVYGTRIAEKVQNLNVSSDKTLVALGAGLAAIRGMLEEPSPPNAPPSPPSPSP